MIMKLLPIYVNKNLRDIIKAKYHFWIKMLYVNDILPIEQNKLYYGSNSDDNGYIVGY